MFIKGTLLVFLLGLLLAGCAAQPAGPAAASTATLAVVTPAATVTPAPSEIPPTLPAATAVPTSTAAATPTAQDSSTTCNPAPVVVPTLPAKIPGYTELDETTGLHITGTYQQIDLATYRLKVSGLVDQPLSLTYDELRCLPKVTDNPPLVCPGFFRDVASWSGVPIKDVLKLAGVQAKARTLTLISADGYRTSLLLEEALKAENFLAYELEGKPLPVLHGFPLRAVFPGLEGNKWAKWVMGIEID
jgi:DMSO/TMAO reductase YedYZ molybdopterin-dependent catalytic subunit